MKKTILLVIIIIISFLASVQAFAQKKPSNLAIPDVNKMMSMSPAELAKYKEQLLKQAGKQLEQNAEKLNISIDQTVLPGSELVKPIRNIEKLSLIPSSVPTQPTLLKQVKQMKTTLSKVDPVSAKKADTIVAAAGQSVKQLQAGAIASWYGSNAPVALLLGIKAVEKDANDINSWNNLATMLNLSGMEHRAVPMLQYCLGVKPGNPTILNNLGQSYMGMGDLAKAKTYLQQSLQADSHNPEANRSMALLSMYDNDYNKALEYFEKEMQIAQRRSSLRYLAKNGNRDKLNITALRKNRMKSMGIPERNLFEEINLSIFKIPDAPTTIKQGEVFWKSHEGLAQSMINEAWFWGEASKVTAEQLKAEGRRHVGLYAYLVEDLIKELGDAYSPLLHLIDKHDAVHLTNMTTAYYKKLNEVVCPQPPMDPNGGSALMLAYQKKCCDMKNPITEAYMEEYNTYIKYKADLVQGRWKEYINAKINIMSLNPTPGNKRSVYFSVNNYFNFLIQVMQSFKIEGQAIECPPDGMTSAQADAIIAAKHDFDFDCPSWMKLNFSLHVAKLKADCQSYGIEVTIEEIFKIGGEKKFKTGTSTLYVGLGVDAKFHNVISGKASQQLYVVFDQNNDFADLGIRGDVSGTVINGMLDGKIGYDFAMNGGFSTQGEIKSKWVGMLESGMKVIK